MSEGPVLYTRRECIDLSPRQHPSSVSGLGLKLIREYWLFYEDCIACGLVPRLEEETQKRERILQRLAAVSTYHNAHK